MQGPLSLAEIEELERLTAEMDRRGLIDPDFGHWLTQARAEFRWDAPHFRLMQGTLNRITKRELMRVIFQVAIRHGKSEHNTISYNAYLLERDPTNRLLILSYAERMAHKFSRAVRKLAESRGVAVSRDRNTSGEWETEAGGGVIALGVGSGIASLNADYITIDDPIGKRADAESAASRESVFDAITNDILARTTDTPVILTMSRWHTDDPVGRLRDGQAGDWHVVDLPGRAETQDATPDSPAIIDPLGRANGEPLWEAERGRDWLDTKLAELGSYGFASLIQGRPRPREGGMFKWDWWGIIDQVPAQGRLVRYWDTAGTDVRDNNDPDYTAGGLVCRMVDLRTAIVDMERFRCGVAQRDARMVEVAKADRAAYGARVSWWIETETGIGGRERMNHLMRLLQNTGISVQLDPRPTGSKPELAQPLASKAEAGNVVLVRGEWNDAFRLEAADFPGGSHDDQVDAARGADAKLSVARNTGAVQTVHL